MTRCAGIDTPFDSHVLLRDSPKGTAFRGTCLKCGIKGLGANQANDPCSNPAGLTSAEGDELVQRHMDRLAG